MNKEGRIIRGFGIRLFGAAVGSIGFFLLAYRFSVIGTTLIGIGSIFIALGESQW